MWIAAGERASPVDQQSPQFKSGDQIHGEDTIERFTIGMCVKAYNVFLVNRGNLLAGALEHVTMKCDKLRPERVR